MEPMISCAGLDDKIQTRGIRERAVKPCFYPGGRMPPSTAAKMAAATSTGFEPRVGSGFIYPLRDV
jgi:hypothetical protein